MIQKELTGKGRGRTFYTMIFEEKIYMLFAGWEVRIVKNCDRGLKNAAEFAGRGQHFQGRGHSFSLYGPTLSREITYLFFCVQKNCFNFCKHKDKISRKRYRGPWADIG